MRRRNVRAEDVFVSAAVLYYLAQGGPFELLGHLMFTFHMINMSLSYLIVPPLLLLGIPAFMWRRCLAASSGRS